MAESALPTGAGTWQQTSASASSSRPATRSTSASSRRCDQAQAFPFAGSPIPGGRGGLLRRPRRADGRAGRPAARVGRRACWSAARPPRCAAGSGVRGPARRARGRAGRHRRERGPRRRRGARPAARGRDPIWRRSKHRRIAARLDLASGNSRRSGLDLDPSPDVWKREGAGATRSRSATSACRSTVRGAGALPAVPGSRLDRGHRAVRAPHRQAGAELGAGGLLGEACGALGIDGRRTGAAAGCWRTGPNCPERPSPMQPARDITAFRKRTGAALRRRAVPADVARRDGRARLGQLRRGARDRRRLRRPSELRHGDRRPRARGAGFRVGIIAQPTGKGAAPFAALGRPNLFFGITAGNMDSMVNRLHQRPPVRSDDAYTPGGEGGRRPDRS